MSTGDWDFFRTFLVTGICFFGLFLTIFARLDTSKFFLFFCSSPFRPKTRKKIKKSEIGHSISPISDFSEKTPRHGRRQISDQIGHTEKKGGLEIGRGSGPTPVARGGSGAKAPPLAARPVPWNGRGRRLMELTEGCYSGGDSQWLSRSLK